MLAQEYWWKAVTFYCLGKQQGHQITITMVTNNSTILQELGRDELLHQGAYVSFGRAGRGLHPHGVQPPFALHHLDEIVQSECKKDYVTDPNTGEVKKTCPKFKYLLHLMKKMDFVPSVERFFCSGCLTTKKIPPPGYGKVTAV